MADWTVEDLLIEFADYDKNRRVVITIPDEDSDNGFVVDDSAETIRLVVD
jgi:hypothetical protein